MPLISSDACERNKHPIGEQLTAWLSDTQTVLEIGSGTGQHAVHFAALLPQLSWQTSDVEENHPGIKAWLEAFPQQNLLPPLALNVLTDAWPAQQYDAIFTANTSHIMSKAAVAAMFEGIGKVLQTGGQFISYGPFLFDDWPTAASNHDFDAHLQARDPAMGLREFNCINELAQEQDLVFQERLALPANNFLLRWIKVTKQL